MLGRALIMALQAVALFHRVKELLLNGMATVDVDP